MGLTIQYKGPGDMKVKAKGFNKAAKAGLAAMLDVKWHRQFLRHHFQMEAYTRYRNVAPTLFKRRYKRPRRGEKRQIREPLVKTGELRRNALRSIVVSGTAKRVKGKMPGTNKANFGAAVGHNMVEELRVVNKTEAKEMAKYFDAHVQAYLTGPTPPRKLKF